MATVQRRILNAVWVLVGVSLLAVGWQYYQASVSPFRNCTPGFVSGVPTVEGLATDPLEATLGLEPVADLAGTTAMTEHEGRLLVANKNGSLVSVDGKGSVETLFVEDGIVVDGVEQGLLDVAVHPDAGWLLTTVTRDDDALEVRARPLEDLEAAFRSVFVVEQPDPTHNGGDLAVGADGLVYLSIGDGGPADDPGVEGQNLDSLLGSIVRLEITPDGELVTPEGVDRPQVAYGLRNPWRFSIDRETGDLWLGDVGNSCREEIDVVPAGSEGIINFGWSALEGSSRGQGPVPDDQRPPVIEYGHGDDPRCAVVGGVVYRGRSIPELRGHYLFGDYCSGEILALELDGVEPVAVRDTGLRVGLLTSFAESADGEVFVASSTEGVFRLVGGDD